MTHDCHDPECYQEMADRCDCGSRDICASSSSGEVWCGDCWSERQAEKKRLADQRALASKDPK